jgi:hypothetical protein
MQAWLTGFTSGYALAYAAAVAPATHKEPLKGVSVDQLYLWVDTYCKDNPLSSMTDAGDALWGELVKRAR